MTGDQQKMLDDCLAAECGLSGWELDFVDNLDQHWRARELTDRQTDSLVRIVEKL